VRCKLSAFVSKVFECSYYSMLCTDEQCELLGKITRPALLSAMGVSPHRGPSDGTLVTDHDVRSGSNY
jgi:hypothetical protein